MTKNEIVYSADATMALVESNPNLIVFYHQEISGDDNPEIRLPIIFSTFVLNQPGDSAHVKTYNELLKEFQFCPNKMRRFLNRDAMIRFVVNDLQEMGNEENYALRVTFNGYVLEDSAMRGIYKTL